MIYVTFGVFGVLGGVGCQGSTRTFDLKTGESTTFERDFTEGKKVEIWLHSEGKPDVALEVKGGEKKTEDVFGMREDKPGPGKDGYLRFIPPVSGRYTVKVANQGEVGPAPPAPAAKGLSKNGPAKGVLTFSEIASEKAWIKPGGLRPGSGNSRAFNLGVNEKTTFYIPFDGGKKVQITVTSTGDSDVDLFVHDEHDQIVKNDTNSSKDCYVEFIAPWAQEYKVVVWNRLVQHVTDHFGNRRNDPRNGPNSGVLRFTESPADAETK